MVCVFGFKVRGQASGKFWCQLEVRLPFTSVYTYKNPTGSSCFTQFCTPWGFGLYLSSYDPSWTLGHLHQAQIHAPAAALLIWTTVSIWSTMLSCLMCINISFLLKGWEKGFCFSSLHSTSHLCEKTKVIINRPNHLRCHQMCSAVHGAAAKRQRTRSVYSEAQRSLRLQNPAGPEQR